MKNVTLIILKLQELELSTVAEVIQIAEVIVALVKHFWLKKF